MNDKWACEVKIARRFFIVMVTPCAIAYAVAFLPAAIEQLIAGKSNALKVFFFVGTFFAALFLLVLKAKWRIRVTADALHLRRCWGWEKYRFADFEVDAAWKKRLTDSDESWNWVQDTSEISLNFIGGRVVKLPCTYYVPPYELKIALLRALALDETAALEIDKNAAAFREHLTLPKPFNVEHALIRTVPLLI